jgi:hypothetical protein
MMRLLAVPLVVIAALMGTACASASAKTPAERPALNVPPPPDRVIDPVVETDPEPVGELPAPPSSTPPPRSSRPKDNTRNTANEAKTEPKPEAAKPAETTPPPPEPVVPAAPPAQLRTPQTADTSGAVRNVKATIDRARAALNTVDFGSQSDDRKKAYNDVKHFIVQAEEAMRQANFVFAQAVATKAETLAKELAGK